METVMIRIRQVDLKTIRKVFPTYKGETAASYFFRLAQFLQEKRK